MLKFSLMNLVFSFLILIQIKHYLVDYFLPFQNQPNQLNVFGCFKHSLVHAVFTSFIILFLVGNNVPGVIYAGVFIVEVIYHFLIDGCEYLIEVNYAKRPVVQKQLIGLAQFTHQMTYIFICYFVCYF